MLRWSFRLKPLNFTKPLPSTATVSPPIESGKDINMFHFTYFLNDTD